MTIHDYRSEPDYRPFLRAVRRRMRAGMDSCEAIDATIRSPRFRTTVRLGYVDCAMKDVERQRFPRELGNWTPASSVAKPARVYGVRGGNRMPEEALVKQTENRPIQWYEDTIAIRGCELTLEQIKEAYREFEGLTHQEGDRIVAILKKQDGVSEEQFQENNKFLKKDAFRVTVSVIGMDGQSAFGDTEAIFDSSHLPKPIKTIYFTNSTAFRRHANNDEPANRFHVWLHFDKPPLFDPSPLLSSPTPNNSEATINADQIAFFRAAQKIVADRLLTHKRWSAFIHEKFIYDTGLWLLAIPYALYWVTVYNDYLFPAEGPHASFRWAFFVYGIGLSLIAYRILTGYIKWAFPVNVLAENKDRALRHRIVLGGIMMALVIAGVKSLLGRLTGVHL